MADRSLLQSVQSMASHSDKAATLSSPVATRWSYETVCCMEGDRSLGGGPNALSKILEQLKS